MTSRSIRFRLTMMVSALFAVTLVVVGIAARERLQSSLESDAQNEAELALVEFLETGAMGPALNEVPRLVFFNEKGEEISEEEFDALVAESLRLPPDGVVVAESFALPDDELEELLAAQDGAFTTFEALEVGGAPVTVNGDPDGLVLASPVVVGGVELGVGVASPRGPIEDVIRATTTAGVILIPLLTLMVAGATWVTASRALRPVEEIRRQVEQTHLGKLDVRVPMAGTNDEVDRLAQTMNDMLDRLDSAADQQRRFISDASHELRSPITATLATIETVDVESADEWNDVASVIGREQHRLAGLVDDLLLLAQLDEAGLSSQSDVDLDDLALEAATRTYPCEVLVTIEAPSRVIGSERLLRRAVSNLVDNATRHAATVVEITVGETAAGGARIRVDDDGPGVPRARRTEVFERFTRLDEARGQGQGGAGLGLAIARNIADAHDASLVVTDSHLGGARFELHFSRGRASPSTFSTTQRVQVGGR